MSGPITVWLAERLITLAGRLTPPAHRHWAEAMRAEAHYLPESTRLSWARGCVVAAIKLRFSPMESGTFRISRWVMLVEVLGCFGPAALAWCYFTFGSPGFVRLDWQTIEKVFFSVPGGAYVFWMWAAAVFIGVFAPIGLFLGLRYVMLGRALHSRALGYTLIAGPVFQAVLGAVAYLATDHVMPPPDIAVTILCVVLPVAGILHLMYLAKPAPLPPGDASLAAG